MISLDITFFIQLVNFLVSLFIINHFIIKPIRSNMARRKALVVADNNDAEKFSEHMNKKNAEYDERISAVRSKIASEREQFKQSAEDDARIMLNKANDDARAIRQESTQKIQNESKEAISALQEKVQAFSKEALAKILA